MLVWIFLDSHIPILLESGSCDLFPQEGEVYELSEDISEELKLMGMEVLLDWLKIWPLTPGLAVRQNDGKLWEGKKHEDLTNDYVMGTNFRTNTG